MGTVLHSIEATGSLNWSARSEAMCQYPAVMPEIRAAMPLSHQVHHMMRGCGASRASARSPCTPG